MRIRERPDSRDTHICVIRVQVFIPFINEFHYDNAGTDVDEFIEVAFPADMDEATVKAHTIVLINGRRKKNYGSLGLNAAEFTPEFPNTSPNGIRFAVVYPEWMRNGGSYGDGIVLMDGSNNILQFLCYENYIHEVTQGPAAGEACGEELSVQETSSTPVGHSLQLGEGTGCSYGDFTWQGPQVATPGFPNVGAGQALDCGVVSFASSGSFLIHCM